MASLPIELTLRQALELAIEEYEHGVRRDDAPYLEIMSTLILLVSPEAAPKDGADPGLETIRAWMAVLDASNPECRFTDKRVISLYANLVERIRRSQRVTT